MSVPDLDEFRAEATAFLDARAGPAVAGADGDGPAFVWGAADERVAIVEENDPEQERAGLEVARRWVADRFDAGFGWIDGPAAYGGRGLSAEHARAYRELEQGYRTPDLSGFTVGFGMVGPTVLAHASEAVKRDLLPRLYRGDTLACQLFSEPGAGSDLASLATRAERDGDEWVITGQKVWTSGAHLADVGEVICRSDPDQPKHRGMTAFLVDMRAPGVEVRPLRQMTGGASFNEVFLTGARVPDTHRLGDVNGGWGVAVTTLMNERASIGGGMGLGPGPGPFERLIALVRHFGLAGDPLVRTRLAALYTSYRANSLTLQRGAARQRAGHPPGPELSTAKLAGTRYLADVADFVSEALGPRLLADTGEWGTFAWNQLVSGVPGARLGGGSDEVLRNVIAERALGLPKEPAVDRDVPFRDLAPSRG
jgi:alkylation response protein AidB-like acyl-CoA dehydrogenase